MEKINYIQHHMAFFSRVLHDDRLTPFHISLYQALFQYWNFNRFKKEFSVARSDLMNLSKVKSKTTYSKCLNELKKWQYLDYKPSNNPYVKSTFNLTINWTTNMLNSNTPSPPNGLPTVQPSSFTGQDVVLLDKTYKHKHINNKRRPVSQNEVIIFFEKKWLFKNRRKEILELLRGQRLDHQIRTDHRLECGCSKMDFARKRSNQEWVRPANKLPPHK